MRCPLLLALPLLAVGLGPAAGAAEQSGLLFSRPALPTGRAPHASVLADVNGDGLADLVSRVGVQSPSSTLGVSVMLGRSDGMFDPMRRTGTERPVVSFDVGDVDGDGFTDVLAARGSVEGAYEAVLLAGTGGPTLQPPVALALPRVSALSAGRLLDDALPVVALATDRGLEIHRQSAALAFELDRVIQPRGVRSLLAGDLDGDGSDELIAARADASVTIYRSLEPAATTYVPGLVDLDLVDVIGDGRPELVTASGSGRVAVYDAHLSVVAELPGATGESAVAGAAGDLDGDGLLDLVRATHDAYVTVQLGSGRSLAVSLARPAEDVLVADVTADGFDDILAVEPDTSAVEVLQGNEAAAFAHPRPRLATSTLADRLVLADVDADGDVDVVASESQPGLPSLHWAHVFVNDGAGRLSLASRIDTDGQPQGLDAGDVNGDDRVDLVVSDWHLGVSQFLGNGDGTFVPRRPAYPCRLALDVAVADLDGDGYDDAAALCHPNLYPTLVMVLRGTPAGLVAPTTVLLPPMGGQPAAIRAGDLDGDGALDLVAASDSGDLAYALGDGDGGFDDPRQLGLAGEVGGLDVGDVTGDGRADIVASLTFQDQVQVVSLDEAGEVAADVLVASHEYPLALRVADATGDGSPDVVLGHGPSVVSVIAGGTPELGAPTAYTASDPIRGEVDAADLTGDGRPEILAAQRSFVETFLGVEP